MATRKLKNGGRRSAMFGAEAGAILAAAGINVAGTLAASAIGANATKKAAQDQSKKYSSALTKEMKGIVEAFVAQHPDWEPDEVKLTVKCLD